MLIDAMVLMGIFPIDKALKIAKAAALDLVQVSLLILIL